MLKIAIDGNSFDLYPDMSLNLIYENPLFVTDRIPTAHSLFSTLPPTRHNLKLLGYPNRLNIKTKVREYANLRVLFGPHTFLKGVLLVTEFDKDIKFYIRGAIFSDEIRGSISSADLDQENFGDVGSRFTPNYYLNGDMGYEYREFIEGTLTGPDDVRVAPIRIKEVMFPGGSPAPTLNGWFATTVMYFSYFNPNREEFMLGYPSFQAHTVCFPLLTLKYLVSEIFGSSLVNNPFAVGELADLVLTSTFHPKFSSVVLSAYRGMLLDSTEIDNNQFLELESFSSAMAFNEMLKQVMKLFCMTLFVKGNSFEFKYNKDILADTSKSNWSDKLIGELAHWLEPGLNYAYGYSDCTCKEKPAGIIEVNNIEDLALQTVTDDNEKEIYVTNTNQLFNLKNRFDDETGGVSPEYEFETEVLDPGYGSAPNTPKSGFNLISTVTPLPINIHPYWWENTGSPISFGRWYVPEWSGDRLLRPEIPNILIFRGLRDTLTNKAGSDPAVKDKYPYLSAHNVDAYGQRLGDLSLHWEGADGLKTNYHTEFQSWIEADKVKARGIFRLSALDLKNLDMSERKHVDGMDFIPEKVEVSFKVNKIEPARVTLVEAPISNS
ncbi:MAG: hypothetical protein RIC03_12620 [Cyclobacteriaceae bacterium]